MVHARRIYLEFKFQSIYRSTNFISGPCAEITVENGYLKIMDL